MKKKYSIREKRPEIPLYKLWEDTPKVFRPEDSIPKGKWDYQIYKVK